LFALEIQVASFMGQGGGGTTFKITKQESYLCFIAARIQQHQLCSVKLAGQIIQLNCNNFPFKLVAAGETYNTGKASENSHPDYS